MQQLQQLQQQDATSMVQTEFLKKKPDEYSNSQ
jgi:hypothetical protein